MLLREFGRRYGNQCPCPQQTDSVPAWTAWFPRAVGTAVRASTSTNDLAASETNSRITLAKGDDETARGEGAEVASDGLLRRMWFVSRADGLVITDPSTRKWLKGTIKASDWEAHLALIQEPRLGTEVSKLASDTPAAGQCVDLSFAGEGVSRECAPFNCRGQ